MIMKMILILAEAMGIWRTWWSRRGYNNTGNHEDDNNYDDREVKGDYSHDDNGDGIMMYDDRDHDMRVVVVMIMVKVIMIMVLMIMMKVMRWILSRRC